MEYPDAAPVRPGGSENPGRRHFLEFFLGTSVFASLVSFFYPVLRYLVPPAQAELGSNLVLAGHTDELKPNTGNVFRFGDRPALLILAPDGNYHALSAVCTHLGCTVQYRSDLQEVWCACHNGKYTITGKNISGPPPKPLEEYSVFIKGKDIYVQRQKNA